jgi:uncharacterized protein YajQ (UPF0234 family)
MSITPKKRIDTTRPFIVREYDIGGKKYVVKASTKAGATEDAATKIRRLIKKEIAKRP